MTPHLQTLVIMDHSFSLSFLSACIPVLDRPSNDVYGCAMHSISTQLVRLSLDMYLGVQESKVGEY